MVRSKPSIRLDRGVDILTLSLRDRLLIMFMLINTATRRDKVGPWSPVVGESVPIHKPERKANGCLGTLSPTTGLQGPTLSLLVAVLININIIKNLSLRESVSISTPRPIGY